MRFRPAYYQAFGLKDGTIFSVLQTRKPLKSQLRPRERVDEDGIWRWHIYTADNFVDLSDRHCIIRHVGMAGRLNTRRALRDLVSPRLDAIEQSLARIEKRLDELAHS